MTISCVYSPPGEDEHHATVPVHACEPQGEQRNVQAASGGSVPTVAHHHGHHPRYATTRTRRWSMRRPSPRPCPSRVKAYGALMAMLGAMLFAAPAQAQSVIEFNPTTVEFTEGNRYHSGDLMFTITITPPASVPITISTACTNNEADGDTASATTDDDTHEYISEDYLPGDACDRDGSRQVIPAMTASYEIGVFVLGDFAEEPHEETMRMTLSEHTGTPLSEGIFSFGTNTVATATIIDDDPPSSFFIARDGDGTRATQEFFGDPATVEASYLVLDRTTSVAEGDVLPFYITSNATSSQVRTVRYEIGDIPGLATPDTAVRGQDYIAPASGTITFAAYTGVATVTFDGEPGRQEIYHARYSYYSDSPVYIEHPNLATDCTQTERFTGDPVAPGDTVDKLGLPRAFWRGRSNGDLTPFDDNHDGPIRQACIPIPITILPDETMEGDETVTIRLVQLDDPEVTGEAGEPGNGQVVAGKGDVLTVTITNSNAPFVQFTGDPAAVMEGDNTFTESGGFGTDNGGEIVFTVELVGTITEQATVEYVTQQGTAANTTMNAGPRADYRPFGQVFDTNNYTRAEIPPGTLTFMPGDTSKYITVELLGDLSHEADENFFMVLSNPTGEIIVGSSMATGTIENDDAAPVMRIVGETTRTVTEDGGHIVFNVTPNVTSSRETTVTYAASAVSATAGTGQDFTAVNGTITVTEHGASIRAMVGTSTVTVDAGNSYGTTETLPITVPILTDTAAEDPETFTFRIAPVGGAPVNTLSNATVDATASTVTVTIIDDDPGLVYGDATMRTGRTITQPSPVIAASTSQTYHLSLNTAPGEGETVTIEMETFNSGNVTFPSGSTHTLTFTADTAYTPQPFTLTAPATAQAGETMVNVGVTGYTGVSDSELTVLVSTGPGVTVNPSPVTMNEGQTTEIAVRLSEAPSTGTSVTLTPTVTGDTSALTDTLATLTFTDTTWNTPTTVTLTAIVDDDTAAATATITYAVTSADADYNNDTMVPDEVVTVTINDLPTLSIGDATATEDVDAQIVFTVRLDMAASEDIMVRFLCIEGTAIDEDNDSGEKPFYRSADYEDGTCDDRVGSSNPVDTATIMAGSTELTWGVSLHEDITEEVDGKTFTLRMSFEGTAPTGVVLAGGGTHTEATGTINDNDSPPVWRIRGAFTQDEEGNRTELGEDVDTVSEDVGTVQFKVIPNATSSQDTTVRYEIRAGSATEGDDYTASSSGTLTMAAESGVITMTFDDGSPMKVFSHHDDPKIGGRGRATRTEDNSHRIYCTATDEHEGPGEPSAPRGSDHIHVPCAFISVTVEHDMESEQDEQFTIALIPILEDPVVTGEPAEPTNATVADGEYYFGGIRRFPAVGRLDVTIRNVDRPPTVSLAAADPTAAMEGDDGAGGEIVFTVEVEGTVQGTAFVEYRTEAGTASNTGTDPDGGSGVSPDYNPFGEQYGTADKEYSIAAGALTFTAADTTQHITISLVGDTSDEVDEQFTLHLQNPSGLALGTKTMAVGTITDDDDPPVFSILGGSAQSVVEGDTAPTEIVLTVAVNATSSRQTMVTYQTTVGSDTEAADFIERATTTGTGTDAVTTYTNVTLDGTTLPSATGTLTMAAHGGHLVHGGNVGTNTIAADTIDAGNYGERVSFLLTFMIAHDDEADEQGESFTLSLSPVNATDASGLGDATVAADAGSTTVTIIDLGSRSVVASTGSIAVEPKQSSSYTIRLVGPEPTSNVIVALPGDMFDEDGNRLAQVRTADYGSTLTFTTANYETPQSVFVDLVAQREQPFTIEHTISGGGTGWESDTVHIDSVVATRGSVKPIISIDDVGTLESAGEIIFTVKSNIPNPSSSDIGMNYTVHAGTAGRSDFHEGDRVKVGGNIYITIRPGRSQTLITLRLDNDAFHEDTETFRVELKPASSGQQAAEGNDFEAIGTIFDDDDPPVLVLSGGDRVSEGDDNVVFTVNLKEMSSITLGDVVIAYETSSLSATEGDDYISRTGALTITLAADTDVPLTTPPTFTVPIVQDELAEDTETFMLRLHMSTANAVLETDADTGTVAYQLSREVTITDDDGTPGIVFTDFFGARIAPPNAVEPSSRYYYQVSLADRPTADVTLTLSSSDTTQAEVTPATLRFSGSNYARPRQFVVETKAIDESAMPTITLAVSDTGGYDMVADVAIALAVTTDPGITITPDTLPMIAEGDSTEIAVRLDSSPTAPVVLTPTVTGALAPLATLGFDAFDWNIPKTVTISALADDNDATDTITVTYAAGGADGYDATVRATVTITVTDLPTLRIADASSNEADGDPEGDDPNNAGIVFTISMNTVQGEAVSMDYAVSDVVTPEDSATMARQGDFLIDSAFTATAPVPGGRLTIPAGANPPRVLLTLPLHDDDGAENDETFTVTLSNPRPANVVFGNAEATGTIIDNDEPPVLTITAPETVSEGASGGAVFTVTAATTSSKPVTVVYAATTDNDDATADATAGEDTAETTGTVTIGMYDGNAYRSSPSETFTVSITQDTDAEGSETLALAFSASNATLASGSESATTVIVDDDPGLVLQNASGARLDSADALVAGASDAQIYQVLLTSPPSAEVTLTLASSDTDKATLAPATLVFTTENYATAQPFTLSSSQDIEHGDTATVTFGVSDTGGYDAVADVAIAVMFSTRPGVTVAPGTALTADEGGTVEYSVRLDAAPTAGVTLTATVTGARGVLEAPGVLAFDDTNWNIARPVTISVLADDDDDDDTATITYAVSDTGGYEAVADVAITVMVNDIPTLRIADALGQESAGDPEGDDPNNVGIVFTITLSTAQDEAVTVRYAVDTATSIADGTTMARPGDFLNDDLLAASALAGGVLTIAAGADPPRALLTLPLHDDGGDENDETFTVRLSNPSGNAILGRAEATGTIIDDDDPPVLAITAPATVGEDAGTAVFTVTAGSTSSKPVSVVYRTRADADAATTDATANADYTEATGTLTIAMAEGNAYKEAPSETITVPILRDVLAEGPEVFVLALSEPANATLPSGGASSALTIVDNDPGLLFADASGARIAGPTELELILGDQQVFRVFLSSPPSANTTVSLTSNARTVAAVTPAALTFTKANHAAAQRFTISATDDADALPASATVTLEALGPPAYDTLPASRIAVTVKDDAPTVVSIDIAPGAKPLRGDTYGYAEEVLLAVEFSKPVLVRGDPRLQLLIGGKGRRASPVPTEATRFDAEGGEHGEGAPVVVFAYAVKADDETEDGIVIGDNPVFAPDDENTLVNAENTRVVLREEILAADFTVSEAVAEGIKIEGDRDFMLSASAGEVQPVKEGAAVTLTGTATSSGDTDDLEYAWKQRLVGGDADERREEREVELTQVSDENGKLMVTFKAPDNLTFETVLTFVFEVANPETEETLTDEAEVTIEAVNEPPVAVIEAPDAVDEKELVTLDGTDSHDPEGHDIVSYSWRQQAGNEPRVTLEGADEAKATFVAPINVPNGTELVFELTVTDIGDAEGTASKTVRVNAKDFGKVLGHALSRFGRALGASAVDTLGERFGSTLSRTSGTSGVSLDLGLGNTNLASLAQLMPVDGAPPGPGMAGGAHGGAPGMTVGLAYGTSMATAGGMGGSGVIGAGTANYTAAASGPVTANHFDERLRTGGARSLPISIPQLPDRNTLMRSSFEISLTGNHAAGNPEAGDSLGSLGGMPAIDWTAWGRFDSRAFEAAPEDSMSLDGSVTIGYVGVDGCLSYCTGVVGMALGTASSDVKFKDDGLEGNISLSMLGFYPYGSWTFSPSLTAWGLFGLGGGSAEITSEIGHKVDTDIGMFMVAAGAHQDLGYRWNLVDLALKGDVFMVNTSADAVDQRLSEATASVQRVRAGLEVSQSWLLSDRLLARPSLTFSGRMDGGDAETGFGAEFDAGLGLEDESGLSAEIHGRFLLLHQEEGISESGFSVMVHYDPGEPGGLVFALSPTWGNTNSVGNALWGGDRLMLGGLAGSQGTAATASGGLRPDAMHVELQYGMVLRSWLVTPYGTLNTTGSGSGNEQWGLRIRALELKIGEFSVDVFGQQGGGAANATITPGLKGTLRLPLR